MFWQTVVDDQRTKLKLQLNGIEIEGLADTGANVMIISPKSWNSEWPVSRNWKVFSDKTNVWYQKVKKES